MLYPFRVFVNRLFTKFLLFCRFLQSNAENICIVPDTYYISSCMHLFFHVHACFFSVVRMYSLSLHFIETILKKVPESATFLSFLFQLLQCAGSDVRGGCFLPNIKKANDLFFYFQRPFASLLWFCQIQLAEKPCFSRLFLSIYGGGISGIPLYSGRFQTPFSYIAHYAQRPPLRPPRQPPL